MTVDQRPRWCGSAASVSARVAATATRGPSSGASTTAREERGLLADRFDEQRPGLRQGGCEGDARESPRRCPRSRNRSCRGRGAAAAPSRLSTTWRTATATGSRIAVRLIAGVPGEEQTDVAVDRRAGSPRRASDPRRRAPRRGRRRTPAGRGGEGSTRVGSGSRGRSRHPSCRSCLCGPSGLRSRRRRTSHRPRPSVFRGSSGSRPGFPVPLAGLVTQGGFGADAGR